MFATRPVVRHVCLAWLFSASLVAAQEPPAGYSEIRKLERPDYVAAIQLRDQADILFANFRRDFPTARRGSPPGIDPLSKLQRMDELIAAHTRVLESWPGTEFDVYCSQSLAGVYVYLGRNAEATALLESKFKLFEATTAASDFAFQLGLNHLQANRDPEAALTWLDRVLAPPDLRVESEASSRYFGVQEVMLRCEVELGRLAAARSRATAMKQLFPHLERQIDTDFEFQRRTFVERVIGQLSDAPEGDGNLVTLLNFLDGETLNQRQVRRIKVLLNRDEIGVRNVASRVLLRGARDVEAQADALAAIAEALNKVASDPRVDERIPGVLGRVESTRGEDIYRGYMNALTEAAADNAALQVMAQDLTGLPRRVVLLALARRGDVTVHQDLIVWLRDAEAGVYRSWAAHGLREIGTAEDLPLLREVAANDPFVREARIRGSIPPRRGPTYPVREAAQAAIGVIERRSAE